MRHPSLPVVVGSLFLFVAARAPAAEPLAEQFSPILVSDPNEASQDIGSGIAADARGNFVTVWLEQNADVGSSFQVFARRMSFSGVPLTDSFRVNAPGEEYSLWPSVASDASGNFVVAWGYNPSGDLQSITIKARRFDTQGAPVGPIVQINAPDTLSDSGPRIAMNDAGDYVIAWSRKGSPSESVARAYDAEGIALGPEFVIPLLTPTNSALIGLAITNERKVVVSGTQVIIGAGNDFQLQCYDTQGVPISAATDVSLRTPQTVPGSTGDMTVTANGRILMVWPQVRIDPPTGGLTTEVQVKSLASDCVTTDWSVKPFSGPGSEIGIYDVSLSTDPTGTRYGVAWVTSQQTTSLQVLNELGAALSETATIIGGADYALLTAPRLALRRHRISAAWGHLDVTDAAPLMDVFARGFFLGSTPDAYVETASLEFGEQAVGFVSTAQVVQIANDGNAPLVVGAVTASGDFTVSSNSCVSAVAPGATCAISLTFRPTRAGDRSGELQINSDSEGSPNRVPLSGVGKAVPIDDVFGSSGGGALSLQLLAMGLVLVALRRRVS